MAETTQQLKPNMLFRYAGPSWCRHGIAITIPWGKGLIATDTYWQDPQMHCISPEDLEPAEFLGDLDEFRKSTRDECDRFEDSDWLAIPLGARSGSYWIRKSASPTTEKVLAQIDYKIELEEANIRHAKWSIERLKEEREKYAG
jgi:hypothetical protein